jgi:glycosyltransferase involved in cell wall biosynthesis
MTNRLHLALFLTRAVPLRRWDELGILERETALYRRLVKHLDGVSLITDGGPEELRYQEQLPGVRILYNHWRLSPNLYSFLAPLLHWQALRETTVYRTNQLDGAWTAVLAAWLHHKPVVVRAGYGWALNFRRDYGETRKARLIRHLEGWTLRHADHIVMTTPELCDYVVREHGVLAERVSVIPNYVDTEQFRPLPDVQSEPGRIAFLGTFNAAKNLPALLQAVAQVSLRDN